MTFPRLAPWRCVQCCHWQAPWAWSWDLLGRPGRRCERCLMETLARRRSLLTRTKVL